MAINCFAAFETKKNLNPFSYVPEKLKDGDIEVEITHCGICHSDIHLIDNDWAISTYPFVPGHEIIGNVKNKGSQVTDFAIGDRIGIGWQRSSCLHCPQCLKGDDNLCPVQEATCVGHFGGFADKIITDSHFVFHIPPAIPSEKAAPLLCGGATVFSPLYEFPVTKFTRVAVIGIGGLGHLAILFAKAMGADVTAISTSPQKKQEATALGADNFIVLNDAAAMQKHASKFDLLICSASSFENWQLLISLIGPRGKLCVVGAPQEAMKIAAGSLIECRRHVFGSNIACRAQINQMLQFAAKHKIFPMVEVFSMKDVNTAIEKVRNNQVRYRAVLVK